jgi:hypothetical protein
VIRVGVPRDHRLGGERCAFHGASETLCTLGAFEACSLPSPMQDFADHAAAPAVILDPHGPGPRIHVPPRPNLGTLLAGRPAEAAATLLPTLYALCGQAHHLAARLAVDTARHGAARATEDQRRALADEIVREHVRSVFLDWPQQLAHLDESGLALRQAALLACPLFRKTQQKDEIVAWAAQHLFGQPPDTWFAIFESDATLETWCRLTPTAPARWLAAVIDDARACGVAPFPALPLEPMAGERARLCDWLLERDRSPWPGTAYETGSWFRTAGARDAADRLAARLREIADLLLQRTPLPGVVAWSPRPGRALILVEIARGILLHATQLDQSGSTIEEYGMLAPTDWNFAAFGPVAEALDAVARHPDPQRRTALGRLVATAYSPCLPFEVRHAAA